MPADSPAARAPWTPPRRTLLSWLVRTFGPESLAELISTLRRNKLRTLLTGLSVAWGTCMLVVLLGAGRGLENGVTYEFRDDALNSIWIWSGRTSQAFAGRGPGRDVRFKNDDYDTIRRSVPGVEHLTGRYHLWGEFTVRYGDRRSAFDILGSHPDQRFLEKTVMTSGRYINELDLRERRKVAVIGELVRTALFKTEDPVGKTIMIRGLAYRVIGVFKDEGGENELRKIYVPITTAQLVYNDPARIHQLMLTVGDADVVASKAVQDQVHRLLAARHQVSLDDTRALRTQNNLERFQKVTTVFTWVNGFVWIVSLGTLLAGMVSVSNIMLISVAERTREIGVRKALGATPLTLVGMVLFESILITAISGYAGLVFGVSLVEFVAERFQDIPFIREPSVDLRIALLATALIVVSGALAGLFPALRAARVNPIVALRSD
ncbi:MAG TPA: ABC transporter permease [Polyangiaceae bacterium]